MVKFISTHLFTTFCNLDNSSKSSVIMTVEGNSEPDYRAIFPLQIPSSYLLYVAALSSFSIGSQVGRLIYSISIWLNWPNSGTGTVLTATFLLCAYQNCTLIAEYHNCFYSLCDIWIMDINNNLTTLFFAHINQGCQSLWPWL